MLFASTFLGWLASSTVYWFQKINPRVRMSQTVVPLVVPLSACSRMALQCVWRARRSQASAGYWWWSLGCPVSEEGGAALAPLPACLL